MSVVVREGAERVEVHTGTDLNRSRSAVMYRVGGRQYPMKSAPQCKVCQHHSRQQIESLILQGVGYAAIVRRLGLHEEVTDDQGRVVVQALTSRNVGEHIHNGHMPVNESITRVIMEDRARELGRDFEGDEANLADHITFARVSVARVFQRLQSGEIEPTMRDAIRLTTLLARIDLQAAEEGMDQDAMLRGFAVYMEAMREECTPQQIAAIGRRIVNDPVMRSLLGRSKPIEAQSA